MEDFFQLSEDFPDLNHCSTSLNINVNGRAPSQGLVPHYPHAALQTDYGAGDDARCQQPHGMRPPEQFIWVPLRLVKESCTSPNGVTRDVVVPPSAELS